MLRPLSAIPQRISRAATLATDVHRRASRSIASGVAGPSRWAEYQVPAQHAAHTRPKSTAATSNGQGKASQAGTEVQDASVDRTASAAGVEDTSSPSNEAVTTDTLEQKPDFRRSASEQYATENRLPLPTLSSPLGVEVAPSSRKLSWTERREQQFDHERRISRRKAIVKEATRGYFHDFHAMRSHGGKTWLAPSTMIRQDRALYFPSIVGTSLANKEKMNTADMLYGKVSLVSFLTSQASELHAKSFNGAVMERYQNDPNFQIVQINLQENVIKAYLVGLFISALRKQIPEPLHATYLLSHQDLTTEREALRLDNKHVGYTYLVGPDGKIRWAGGAFAEPEEQQALVVCTGVLLSRMSSGKGKQQNPEAS